MRRFSPPFAAAFRRRRRLVVAAGRKYDSLPSLPRPSPNRQTAAAIAAMSAAERAVCGRQARHALAVRRLLARSLDRATLSFARAPASPVSRRRHHTAVR